MEIEKNIQLIRCIAIDLCDQLTLNAHWVLRKTDRKGDVHLDKREP